MRKVEVSEIPELRAYNQTRDALRREVIALKARRRVHLSTLITMVFENTDTVRWQITEMMRVERIVTDDALAHEVNVYNDLVPNVGELSCTMFLELTDDESMREWLPKLVGIHDSIELVLSDGSRVRGFDPKADRLTRQEVTCAVHYLKFVFDDEQRSDLTAGRVSIEAVESIHPLYRERSQLSTTQQLELHNDLSAA